MVSKMQKHIGRWAFLIGVILAVIVGLMGTSQLWILWLLVIAGIIVGLMNVADDEVRPFLWSSLALIIASALGGAVLNVVPILGDILQALLVLFVPATIIVAIKNVFSYTHN